MKKPNKLICAIIAISFLFNFVITPDASACWWKGFMLAHSSPDIAGRPGPGADSTGRNNQKTDGDPIYLHNGDFVHTKQDLLIPSRGLNIEIKRTYKSQSLYNGPVGVGWDFNYNQRIVPVSNGDAYYLDGLGASHRYGYIDGKNYITPSYRFDKLTQNTDGTWTLKDKHGQKTHFDQIGRIKKIEGRNQNSVTFSYSAELMPIIGYHIFSHLLTIAPQPKIIAYDWQIIKITDPAAREMNLSYDSNGRLVKITDFSARTIEYKYDQNGHLIEVKDPQGNTTKYSYDTDHNLTEIIDANGNTYLKNFYNPEDKVISQKYGDGEYYFSYDTNNRITEVTDRNNFTWKYYFNESGNPTKIIDPQENETQNTYDSHSQLTKVTYPEGNSISYEYDSNGNLTKITRSPKLNSPAIPIATTFTYESNYNFIKSITDPKVNKTTYYYDYEEATLGDLNGDGVTDQNKGNLVKIDYPKINNQTPQVKFRYNQYGQVEKVTDPNSIITRYSYDINSLYLTDIINDFGDETHKNYRTSLGYDLVGNIASITDARSNKTTFTYDKLNRLIQTANPKNILTKYTYDKNGNLTKLERQANELGTSWQITEYTYTTTDKLKIIRDNLNNVTEFIYDKNENRTQIIDAEGNITKYEYNSRNLLAKVIDAENNITEYIYDRNGNLFEIKDAKQNKTTYTYDDFDRLIKTAYADSSFEEYSYDENSNLSSKTTPKLDTITYTYDALNRLVVKTYPDATNVVYDYDLASRLKSLTDANGTISYNYDNLSRATKVTYPNSKEVSYEYDAIGNRTKLTYPDSTYITYAYDELNRLTSIKDQVSSILASYTYDTLSRRTGLNLLNGANTTYSYDAINRLQSLISNLTSDFSYTYDKVGNRLSMTDDAGTHNYAYDKIYQLTNVVYPDTSSATYDYDNVGNRTSTINGGTTNYTTNNLNQYTKVATNNYTYDNNGNLINDGTWTYTYDYENRLLQATSSTLQADYKYDAFGRRIEKNVDGAITKFLYDGDQVICEYDGTEALTAKYIYGPGIDEPIRMEKGGQNYYYHFDGLGSVTALTDSSGTVAEQYTYDVFGKPSNISSIGNRFMFTGREYDVEAGFYYYRERYFSPTIGRFLQRDPLKYYVGMNLYKYVDNNPINWIDPWGLARIGSRKLDGKIPFNRRGNLRHDQIWYDDGTNSGFFNDDTIRSDKGHTRGEYDFRRDPKYYDDDLMRQAEKNVQKDWDMDWRMPWWDPSDWNNCQNYTDAVRKEYDRLEKEGQKTDTEQKKKKSKNKEGS